MATAQELTDNLVALSTTVQTLTTQLAVANGLIQEQSVRINTLEGRNGAQGAEGAGRPFERVFDMKNHGPDPFTAKDEHRWREWSEEMENYVESVDAHLAGLMRNAPDEDNPIDPSNLAHTKR